MKINTDPQKIKELVERGVKEVINKENLERKMALQKPLRIKFGIDPTAADLHLGHAVALRKLRQFQDMGHIAVLIIGDFTTLIGDPSGRTTSRPALAPEQIRDNMKDYINQAAKVINIDEAEIHYNSEWFGKKPMSFLMDLAGRFTVARLIEREDFQKRLKDGLDVSMLELLYPLLQGFDSVAVNADVELGGYDQRLNLLFGRKVQRAFGQPEQDVITVPLLIGIDGVKKMSKSVGNYIRITESPDKMYSQVMEIADPLTWDYFSLLTNTSQKEIQLLKADVARGTVHPRDAKMKLALKIVSSYWGEVSAQTAQQEFIRVAQEKQLPSEIPGVKVAPGTYDIVDLLASATGAASSKSDAKRLIAGGAVRIDGAAKKDLKEAICVRGGEVIQIGKKKFFKII